MKKTRLFFGLVLGAMLLVACNKPEGDTVPVVNASLSCVINDTTVLKLVSLSSNITVLDVVELTFKKVDEPSDRGDSTVVKNSNVVVGTFLDTIWEWEPNTKYAYRLRLADFVSDTVFAWDTLTTVRVRKPVVEADTAILNSRADTLFLYGTATSLWRAVMDRKGIQPDLHFYWGTPDDMSTFSEAHIVSVAIDTAQKIRFDFIGAIPVSELQDVDSIWYKAYAKQVWGGDENYSGIKGLSLTR